MNTGTTFQPKCGGPPLVLEDDGHVNVTGLGSITRSWNKNVDQWKDLISASASRWDIPEAWIAGVMLQESGGKQQALSPVGAVGLMQIMPSTPKQMFQDPVSKEDLWKPEINIDMGARVLASHANRASWNPVHVAAMYNAGGVYCYSGKNCAQPGLWNVNENCGYCEQAVRGINAAIDAGYSGTGATEQESSGVPWPLKVLAGVGLALFPLVVLVYFGHIKAPSFARNLIPHRNPYRPTWRDYIRGEWWIDEWGEALFADQDVCEHGHEDLAWAGMLDVETVIVRLDELGKRNDSYEHSARRARELYDEGGARAIVSEMDVPLAILHEAVGGKSVWREMVADPRLAYAKHKGAIMVINRNFVAYKVTAKTIERVQRFIYDQADGGVDDDSSTEICIEQIEPAKNACLTVNDFLNAKHLRDLGF